MDPLNPRLFRALQATFRGGVEIANQGQRRSVVYLPDWRHGGKLTAHPSDSGEEYRVNCVFCNDTRKRLYFSYQWGERDPRTGQDNLHLVHCFNEDCLQGGMWRKNCITRCIPRGGAEQRPNPFRGPPRICGPSPP